MTPKTPPRSIRISFTDQSLTAHGGRVVWSHFLHQKRFRQQLRKLLLREGYRLDLDWWALLHEEGHQERVAPGYTKQGLKPGHRPLMVELAEARRREMIANCWLRPGNTACVNGVAEFLRPTVRSLPQHIRIGLVRGDAGLGDRRVQEVR